MISPRYRSDGYTAHPQEGATEGISQKAVLALALSAAFTFVAALVTALLGDVGTAFVILWFGLPGAAAAGYGAWLGSPGDVRYRNRG